MVFLLWFGLALTILVPSVGLLISMITSVPMLYPLAAALLLFQARQKLARGDVDAPRWIRWSMGFALPGSLAVGVGSVFFAILGIMSDGILGALVFVPLVVIGLSSVFVLLRVLFKTDLDELLWSEAGDPLDEALNYSEDEEVEFEFETVDVDAEAQAVDR